MDVDVKGENRTSISSIPLSSTVERNSPLKVESEKPRCSSTPCSPIRRTVSGEELLKLAHKCTTTEENSGETVPTFRAKQHDSGLSRSSRIYKAKGRHYQPYEIPSINGRRRRRMPSSGDKCNKVIPYESYKAAHGPLPLCLLKGKRMHSKSLDYLNLDKMNIKESADTEVLQYQLQHLTLRGDRVFARNNT
uniref:Macrophage immunometabolism regulator n=1 Tax=Pyxicephalus adspersus TaxID=30357 RepID=A0AAV3AKS0_PYXAD|nr:TPA: hypothetical protein GDO54_014293 [Pyxicephalus adspersus]